MVSAHAACYPVETTGECYAEFTLRPLAAIDLRRQALAANEDSTTPTHDWRLRHAGTLGLPMTFDLPTAVVSGLATPVLIFLIRMSSRYVKQWSGFVLEGILSAVTPFLTKPFAAWLSLRRYAQLRLA